MKTLLQKTINKDYRVLWKDGPIKGGYREFTTKLDANNYIKRLKENKHND